MDFLDNITPIKKRTVSQEVQDRISHMITVGTLKQGDQLPTERELALSFNVSRQSIREAIKSLIMAGALTNRQGDGTYVAHFDIASLMKNVKIFIKLNRLNIKPMFEARKINELAVIDKVIDNIKPKELASLQKLVKSQHDIINNPVLFRASDASFHQKLIDIANNLFVKNILLGLEELYIDYRLEVTKNTKLLENSVKQHDLIIQAVQKKNKTLAKQYVSEHIDYIYKTTLEVM